MIIGFIIKKMFLGAPPSTLTLESSIKNNSYNRLPSYIKSTLHFKVILKN
jgi:hypothetical protein